MLHSRKGQLTLDDLKEIASATVELGFDLKKGSPISWRFDRAEPKVRERKQVEFLCDVSSFANQNGGILIYGIKEGTGIVEGIVDGDVDQILLSLSNLCRQHIDPPLVPKIYPVEGGEVGPVIVIEVPDSWAKPHMVTLGEQTLLKIRTNSGKVNMDATTLTRLAVGGHERGERIESFLEAEIRRAAGDRSRAKLLKQSGFFIGISPVATFGGIVFDLTNVSHKGLPAIRGRSGYDGHHNIDGYLSVETSRDGSCWGYVQVFRDGSLVLVEVDENERLPQHPIISALLKQMVQAELFFKENSIRGPFGIRLGHFGMAGASTNSLDNYGKPRLVADNLVLTPLVLGDIRNEETLTSVFRLFVQSLHAKDLDVTERRLIKSAINGM